MKGSNANTNYRIQKKDRWIENENNEYKYAEYQEYRMNTDGLKTADNWQATGVEEWPELDFFSLSWICTFYCIVLMHCISHFLCCDFAHYISYIRLCILYFSHCYTVYLCRVRCILDFFCGEFAHQDWFAAKTLLKFPSCPSQPESKDIFHQNTNKTYFIEIYVQNIWTAIFKILKLTVVFNLTTGQIHVFNGSLGVQWGVGL